VLEETAAKSAGEREEAQRAHDQHEAAGAPSEAECQFFLDAYDDRGLFLDYDEMIIQFGCVRACVLPTATANRKLPTASMHCASAVASAVRRGASDCGCPDDGLKSR
jgi:hypothetical protein